MGPSINPTVVTLAPGQSEQIRAGGAEIFMREIQGANEIKISLDDGDFLPIAAGEGFAAVHGKFRVKNHNAVTVIVTVYQSTEAGVYIDRRDSATSVSIGGEFAVVNSAHTDEGGVVKQLGASNYNGLLDKSGGGAAETVEVIRASLNTGGAFLRSIMMDVSAAPNTTATSHIFTGAPTSYLMIVKSTGIYERFSEFYLPAGAGLFVTTGSNFRVRTYINYDYL